MWFLGTGSSDISEVKIVVGRGWGSQQKHWLEEDGEVNRASCGPRIEYPCSTWLFIPAGESIMQDKQSYSNVHFMLHYQLFSKQAGLPLGLEHGDLFSVSLAPPRAQRSTPLC